jgi:Na+-driven multidrug efflux pump
MQARLSLLLLLLPTMFIIGMFFGMGITYGLTPLVGKAYGNNEPKSVAVAEERCCLPTFWPALL